MENMSKNKRPRNLKLEGLPLRNLTSKLNCPNPAAVPKMSYSEDSGFPNLNSSPMSSLALNLSELSTGRTTPRRRLSLSSLDTPPNDGLNSKSNEATSAESGCFSGSPIDDSPTLASFNKKRYTTVLHPDIPLEAFSAKKKTIAFRRISSEPLPTLRLDSLTDFQTDDQASNDENSEEGSVFSPDDASSQDSGLGMDHERLLRLNSDLEDLSPPRKRHQDRIPSLDDVWNSMDSTDFKAPKGKPPKRTRSVTENEDTCSPIKYSPVKSSLPKPSFAFALFSEKSPKEDKPSKNSETGPSRSLSHDDGFQELFNIEDLQNEVNDEVSSLVSAPLLHSLRGDKKKDCLSFLSRQPVFKHKQVKFCVGDDRDNSTPPSRSAASRRKLQRSQSLDFRPRLSSKRTEPPEDLTDLISRCKRLKGEEEDSSLTSSGPVLFSSNQLTSDATIPSGRRLQRCHSETEATIKSAVMKMAMEPNLIGDCSKEFCLPTIRGKHDDLKCISGETVCKLLCQEYDNIVEEFYVVDCRYPYEYEGGHIKDAFNLYTFDAVLEKFMKSPMAAKNPNKRIIIIFHCEFSSERGPRLCRALRRHDRETNKECYPFLHYPELYLLEGGYKLFFENYDHLCEPRQYRTMLDKNHSEDLRKFRAKAKSWAGEKSQPRQGRNLKF